MSKLLSDLFRKEVKLFSQIESFISNMEMEDTDIDALSLQYEKCIADILAHSATNTSDFSDKLDFIFKMIGRDYDRPTFLSSMHDSLKADLEHL